MPASSTPPEERLFTRLTDDPVVSSLVGSRVTPVLLPDDVTYPAITYSRVSTERITTLSGSTGLARASFQVSAWSPDYLEVLTVASGIRQALDGIEGTLIENQIDLFDTTARVHYANLQFSIWHTEKPTT